MNIPVISPSEASTCEALFLDVREPDEYTQGHIASSALLPLAQVDSAVVSRMLRGDRRCIVVCKAGMRAQKAAQFLAASGVENLSVLEGGMDAWIASGLPVRKGKGGITIQSQTRTIAGGMILVGSLLAMFVDKNWAYLAAFAGCGLMVAGLTGWCGMSILLSKMPWNRNQACTCSK
jgi:rhodanese-related sulfurtransferase